MTKKNLIIVIILLAIIDLVAAGWYISRSIEATGRSQSLFDQRDSTDIIAEADTAVNLNQPDVFDKPQFNTFYFISNTPSISGDQTSYYTSTKHVKVIWPLKVNGDSVLGDLNKELIKQAFGNTQTSMKNARYVYLNTPEFNKPIGDEYRSLTKAPRVYPVYGNVSQVLVYPYMTSQRLLVMEIDKVEYNGSSTSSISSYIHYDRQRQRLLKRLDILVVDVDKENKLLKVINKKIDDLNRGRSSENQLQHALNVPGEIRCGKSGILFGYKPGSISNQAIDIAIDYDKLEPFFTDDFKQLQSHNGDYQLFSDNGLKPEPINATAKPVPAPVAAPIKQPSVKQSSVKDNYPAVKKPTSSKKKRSYVKPKRTSRKRYSGARRRSGYRGYSGRRH